MKSVYNLADLDWKLAGYSPYHWRLKSLDVIYSQQVPEIAPMPAKVPSSVQQTLLAAGLINDWFHGTNSRCCEWVENRHWVYKVILPNEWIDENRTIRIKCMGLDYCGIVRFNGREVYEFSNSHIPHKIELTNYICQNNNLLEIIFTCPPRWLGQIGYTSKITQWKPRFNYGWDWTNRLVQIGIFDDIYLEVFNGAELGEVKVASEAFLETQTAALEISGKVFNADTEKVVVQLKDGDKLIRSEIYDVKMFSSKGAVWNDLNVDFWYPHTLGKQPLYDLDIILIDDSQNQIEKIQKKIGFRHISWDKCRQDVDCEPWVCSVNGVKLFLQGVNWTPIRPNFADLKEQDYLKRLALYRKLGVNLLRVWGGGFLEKQWFYDICDRIGIMVWQEFPLSSSALDNYPPDDKESIEQLCGVARSFLLSRCHHTSLIMFSGGNELVDDRDCPDTHGGCTIDIKHPLLESFAQVVENHGAGRRFVPSSPSGPRFFAHSSNYGKDLHHDVHGPWKIKGKDEDYDQVYWENDDAMFRSEVGAPGPSSIEILNKYKSNFDLMPCSLDNQIWRLFPWWLELKEFIDENGKEPENIEQYIQWGQNRQAKALSLAAKACKQRFPQCGGIIIWMGHDSYPCAANTAIIDFEGNPKPAALALAEVFNQKDFENEDK